MWLFLLVIVVWFGRLDYERFKRTEYEFYKQNLPKD